VFGCIRKLGCLFLLAVGVIAYLTRDMWLHLVRPAPADSVPSAEAGAGGGWQPLTDAGAARARRAVESLGQRSGPAYVSVQAGDLAAYILTELARQLPPSAQDVRAAVGGERLYVRANVALSDFGGKEVLGPLGGFLGDRDTVQFAGDIDVLRPGLAQFRIEEIRIGQLALPRKLIPRIVSRIRRGGRPEGVVENALPLDIPPTIGDVRVARGAITIYKAAPQAVPR
jgi:hypothetical protein